MAETIVEIPEGYTEDDLNRALTLLEADKTKKIKMKAYREKKMNDPEFANAMKMTHLRYQAKRNILIRKGIEAGLKVTDEEIDQELQTK